MRTRAIVQIEGPPGVGKTTFVERLLEAELGLALAVRTEKDAKLKACRESAPKGHAELRRYRAAGALEASLWRFPRRDAEEFFTTRVMDEYSEVVYVEGDDPTGVADLAVFVAPPLPEGLSFLVREDREGRLRRTRETPLALERLGDEEVVELFGTLMGEPIASLLRERPGLMDGIRRKASTRPVPKSGATPRPADRWTLAPGYDGLPRAQLVVVNVRSGAEEAGARAVVEEVGRLRSDEAVFRGLFGPLGSRVAVTAVAANLANPKDPGLKKAIARVKRTVRKPG